jgi:hypothetical protein
VIPTYLLIIALLDGSALEIPERDAASCKAASVFVRQGVMVGPNGERVPLAGQITGVRCVPAK